MIEEIIMTYLNEQVTAGNIPCPCYAMRPADAPIEFVLFEKTGASKTDHITTSTIAFQSYASTLLGAVTINNQVKEAVENMIALSEIAAVHFQSDYNFTDPTTKQPRYQAVFEITHY